jgi:competence protein ComEA
MKAYSREQIIVSLCILSLLFPLAFGKLYRSFPDTSMDCSAAPAAVYELRGAGIEEGYYCFKETQTARCLQRAAGGMQGCGWLAADEPVRTGTRIIFRAGRAGLTVFQTADMSAAARLNFFLPVAVHAATLEDLMLIPGIGSKTAAAIIAYRDKQRNINNVEELINIPGLGENKLQAVAPFITTE